MYDILTGPVLWASFGICIIGLLARVIWYIRGLSWKLDRVAYKANLGQGLRGAARSILYWIVPFGSHGWRAKPGFTILFYAFHAGLIAVPLFLAGHVVLLKEGALGIGWWPSLPQGLADALTYTTLVAAVFIVLRRIALPEVRILTTWYDYLLILISVAPFITGVMVVNQFGDYQFWLLAHIISGEVMLVAIPFTKLYHIVGFFLSRAQLGMDFGIKRCGQNAKSKFAW